MPKYGKSVVRLKIPQNVVLEIRNGIVSVSGSNGKLSKKLNNPKIQIAKEGREVIVSCDFPRRGEKALVGTFAGHIRNMLKGAQENYEYRLKVVYAHFPMKVTLKEKRIIIENFLGEKTPRYSELRGDTKALLKGNEITLLGPNIEDVSLSAASLERATRIKKKDPRIFQDGIYIIQKGG